MGPPPGDLPTRFSPLPARTAGPREEEGSQGHRVPLVACGGASPSPSPDTSLFSRGLLACWFDRYSGVLFQPCARVTIGEPGQRTGEVLCTCLAPQVPAPILLYTRVSLTWSTHPEVCLAPIPAMVSLLLLGLLDLCPDLEHCWSRCTTVLGPLGNGVTEGE